MAISDTLWGYLAESAQEAEAARKRQAKARQPERAQVSKGAAHAWGAAADMARREDSTLESLTRACTGQAASARFIKLDCESSGQWKEALFYKGQEDAWTLALCAAVRAGAGEGAELDDVMNAVRELKLAAARRRDEKGMDTA
jgi:hypothetical protein